MAIGVALIGSGIFAREEHLVSQIRTVELQMVPKYFMLYGTFDYNFILWQSFVTCPMPTAPK